MTGGSDTRDQQVKIGEARLAFLEELLRCDPFKEDGKNPGRRDLISTPALRFEVLKKIEAILKTENAFYFLWLVDYQPHYTDPVLILRCVMGVVGGSCYSLDSDEELKILNRKTARLSVIR